MHRCRLRATSSQAILRRKPRRVVGVDISEKLLEIAAERYPDVQFFQMDMMSLSLAPDSFDFVYSSLAFDYANDWDALLSGVGRLLRAGGRLLFSTHNPRYWAQAPGTGNSFTNRRGITLSQYRMTLQIVGVDIIFDNHPDVDSIHDALTHAGFSIDSCRPAPVIDLTQDEYAALASSEREAYDVAKEKNSPVPVFLICKCRKAG